MSQTQLYRVLNRSGVSRRRSWDGRPKRVLAPADEVTIARQYRHGATKSSLALRYGCSTTRITRVLRDAGVSSRDPLDAHAQRYPVRHDAFSQLDAESAYCAGLAMADGCIARGNTLQLSLHPSDLDHLRKLHGFLGCPKRPIEIRKNMAISRVHSKRLAADLVAHGIVPRKSWGARASEELATFPSFWLGMIDGDGTIFFSRGPTLSLCGSRPLMEQYRDFLAAQVLEGKRQSIATRQPDGLCSVTVQGRTAQRVIAALYSASPVALARKRAIAEEAQRWECAWPRERQFSADDRLAWFEKRHAWQGTTAARTWHVAAIASQAVGVLQAFGFEHPTRWKPKTRSAMVAFHAYQAGRAATVWVTSRWKAEVPRALRDEDSRPLYVLHLNPLDPSDSWVGQPGDATNSFVPMSHLRHLAAKRDGADNEGVDRLTSSLKDLNGSR
jgi:hypothetical protein